MYYNKHEDETVKIAKVSIKQSLLLQLQFNA